MAISERAYQEVFTLKAVQFLLREFSVPVIAVNVELEEIVLWID